MLAAAETFEATHARVFPGDLRASWNNSDGITDALDLAWISYVAPRFADLVTPPPSTIAERRPDGGLLMAATMDSFSTDDPTHMAAAREIKTALREFNAAVCTPGEMLPRDKRPA